MKALFAFIASMVLLLTGQHIFAPQATSFSEVQDHQKIQLKIRDKVLNVEVVNTAQSMTQGLSDRDQIGSDGMLFLLGEMQIPHFWMKDMHFDLDMVWIDNLKIVDISAHVPKPSSPNEQLPIYSSTYPANMVLELNAGDAQRWGLKNGDVFTVGFPPHS